MNYQELRKEKISKYNKTIEDCKVFFAFSNEQFKESIKKLNLAKGEKVTNIGAGGFAPSDKVDKYIEELKSHEAWYKKELAELRKDEKNKAKAIEYELSNYECYYTGDIDDVVELFEGVFTREEIQEVYKNIIEAITQHQNSLS